jgi:hypothetical protein
MLLFRDLCDKLYLDLSFSEGILQMQKLSDCKEAAEYVGLPRQFFTLQVRDGNGPDYVQPSARRKFFTTESLDRWVATWGSKETGRKSG